MEATLRGVSGPGMAVMSVVEEGSLVSVGRTERSNILILGDALLSSVHFGIECRDNRVMLRDLGSSNGTFVNGARVKEHVLLDGDSIAAGSSVFTIQIRSGKADLMEILSTQSEPLFAVLDTARDRKIYNLLLLSGAQYCSLYAGKAAAELEHVAPYLVYLLPRCKLLQQLVTEGWSRSWGIFLTCDQPIEEVRHQLRCSLMVTLEENQEQVYFRFYDPRVLRDFLSIADTNQLAEFSGPISSFLMEGEDPDVLLRFYPRSGKTGEEKIAVSAEKG